MAHLDSARARLDRRQFMKDAGYAVCALGSVMSSTRTAAAVAEDAPNVHNMLIVGEQTIFLSHLPMFQGFSKDKGAFVSPHRFQVILEARFTQAGKDVSDLYVKDRQAHRETRIYTLGPSPFVLSRLFTPAGKPQLAEFTAEVFRGHLELPGRQTISGLKSTLVTVTRVAHSHEFDPKAKKPSELEYVLFGKGSELFLAHTIVGPPDFDHFLSVTLAGSEIKPDDLARDVRVTIRDRKNVAADRLREGQRTPATLRIGGSSTAQAVEVVASREFYFEEGELLVPPTFDPTPEETKKPPAQLA